MNSGGSATLGIGTATFIPGYGRVRQDLPDTDLLRHAIQRGVKYLDTAAAYGNSERALGEINELIAAQVVRVCTKIQPPSNTDADLSAAAQASLVRLKTAQVDTILLHSASRETLTSNTTALRRVLTESGLAKKVGASTYGSVDALLAAEAPWCDVLQIEYSILNQSVWKSLRAHQLSQIEIVARSVLCKGLLTNEGLTEGHPAAAIETVRALSALASEWNMSLPTLAIRFALDTPGIDVVIVGVTNRDELDVAVGAWHRPPLTADQWSLIAKFDQSEADWSHPERWVARGE